MSLEYEIVKPAGLNPSEWGELHAIYHDSFYKELVDKRSKEEINYLTSWNDFKRFHKSHLDPNSEIGGRFNADQSYTSPKVVIAANGDDLIGFGYSANNVSGNMFERSLKLLGTAKRYHWLREFVVHPEYQRQGVAAHMAGMLLAARNPAQPVTAYIWPDEIPFLKPRLLEAGFKITGGRQVNIYGENSEPVRQLRMFAPSATEILARSDDIR